MTDIAGNKDKVSAEFVPDIQSPLLQNDCSMNGLTAFRCKITDSDVSTAVLQPVETWPKDSYTFEVTEEKSGDTTQRWLNFKFKDTMAENYVQGIEITDTFGNSNKDRYSETVLFLPATKAPKVSKVNAFGPRVLELSMDR